MSSFPDELWIGIAQFNSGEFYACHDTLEALWIESPEDDRKFYQGILQVAVGLYHLGNQNWRGAVILMGEGLNRLRTYPSDYAHLELEAFLMDVSELLTLLQTLGPEKGGQLHLETGPEPIVPSGHEGVRSQPYLRKCATFPASSL